MKVSIVVLALVAVVFAEPPVPSSQYLPSNQYIPPSSQYGVPGFGGQTQAVIRPNTQYGTPSTAYGAPGGGYAGAGGYGGYDDQSQPANYHFKYDVQDAQSGNDFGHEEARQGDVAQGKYYVLLPDGRRQVVEYVADNEGYKPKVSYEQVGGGYAGGYPGSAGGYPSGGAGGYPQGGAGGYPGGQGGYQY